MAAAEKIIEKGLKAALDLAASRPWSDIPLTDIAAKAKLTLSDFHGVASREDLVEALDPALIQLERFVDAWHAPDTQVALRALVDKLKK